MDNTLRMLEVPDEDLENGDISSFQRIFGSISDRPNDAKILRGNVAIVFPKYDHDPRPNYIIEEIRSFIQSLDSALPFFLYFLWPEPKGGQMVFWLACLSQPISRKLFGIKRGYGLNSREVAPLLVVRIKAVEAFCEKIIDDSTPVIQKLLRSVPKEVSTLTGIRVSR